MMVRAWIILPEEDEDFPSEKGKAEIWLNHPPSYYSSSQVKPIVYAELDEERVDFK